MMRSVRSPPLIFPTRSGIFYGYASRFNIYTPHGIYNGNSGYSAPDDEFARGDLFKHSGWGNTFYCVRSSNAQIGNQTPVFEQVTPVNMGGDLTQGGINGIGLCGQT